MKQLRTLTLWLLFLGGSLLPAQQRMQYSQYLTNAFLQNPAFAGMEQYADLRLGYSHQWAGFEGAPRGLFLSGHTALPSQGAPPKREVNSLPAPGRGNYAPTYSPDISQVIVRQEPTRFGVGGSIYSEQTGPISYNGIGAGFATHLPVRLRRSFHIAIGGQFELMNYRLDPNQVNLTDANDVAVAGTATNLWLPGLNAGIALYNEQFFLSASSRQLLRSRIQVNPNNPYISRLAVHYNFMAGYRFPLNESISLTPTAALRFVDPAPASWEIGARADFNDQFQIGASYRHQDAVVALVGLKLAEQFVLLYSYDFTTSNLRNQSAGTHGISLAYRWQRRDWNSKRRYFW